MRQEVLADTDIGVVDYPWHDQVLAVQRSVLNRLYNPITLGRIQDNELRFAANEKPFKMADLLGTLSSVVAITRPSA